ncbi:Zn-dependent alcohol dehydrogenase [Pseudooceanicola sp.]|uniref:Zn-dependent alcohol dehydrogenase n=1 Tax=Pseudooceanicola sp. TaxID=1914328 RepID=UPI002604B429|nr:Zn-dependent alcohol dehydrogenase [Pseudooceanicola sp.]MDF1857192.1 Zn-dependent alcohol dehydrogenase [Pseudooceanicola sp.]
MKAAILEQVGKPMEIVDVTLGNMGPHEVRVRTAAVGLCHSDLHYIDGTVSQPMPVVLGHEVSGIVEAVGAHVTRFKPGDHVVGCLSVFCGTCEHCISGNLVQCANPEVKHAPGVAKRIERAGTHVSQAFNLGAFAEEMLVHENAIVKIRDDMPMDRAALIGCGVLTGTGSVIRTAKVPPGSTVAIIGCGGVGLSAVMGAKLAGALRIIAIDMLPNKLALAKEFGATDLINAADGDPVQQVLELTGGGVNFSFECIGGKRTAEQAIQMLGTGGAATLMGVMPADMQIEFSGRDLFARQKKILGCLMGSNQFPTDIPRLCDFYMQGRLPLDQMISNRIRLDQINEGFEALKGGGVARSVITFDI